MRRSGRRRLFLRMRAEAPASASGADRAPRSEPRTPRTSVHVSASSSGAERVKRSAGPVAPCPDLELDLGPVDSHSRHPRIACQRIFSPAPTSASSEDGRSWRRLRRVRKPGGTPQERIEGDGATRANDSVAPSRDWTARAGDRPSGLSRRRSRVRVPSLPSFIVRTELLGESAGTSPHQAPRARALRRRAGRVRRGSGCPACGRRVSGGTRPSSG